MTEVKLKKGKDYIGVGVGALIFNEDGKVLLNKRGAEVRNEVGKWDFPGGGVRFGEKCEEAIKREIKEELDIEIEVLELLDVSDHIIETEGQHWVSPSFITRVVSGTVKNMEPHKCDEIVWLDITEVNPDELTGASYSNYKKYVEKYGTKPYKKQ